MNLLVTGASGFLGQSVSPLLRKRYQVVTLGRNPENDVSVDLSHEIPAIPVQCECVLHAAGKAHAIPKKAAEKKAFFDVNVQGTKNLCAGLEKSGIPKAFIFVSTVAVYGCSYGEKITEEHPLKGTTPYALSKIEAESYLKEWCGKHGVTLGIIRPALIAGPTPRGNLGAMIKGIKNNSYYSIAGGKARKSVLMAEDIVQLIPLLMEKGGDYNVCDSYHPTFRELEKSICKQLNKSLPLSIPYGLAKIAALLGDFLGERAPINSSKLKKITESLTFSNDKAMRELGWKPMSVLENFRIE